jgi:hypothetical protein
MNIPAVGYGLTSAGKDRIISSPDFQTDPLMDSVNRQHSYYYFSRQGLDVVS